MSSQKPLGIGFVGCGKIAGPYAQSAVQHADRLKIVGAYDLAPGRAREFVGAHGGREFGSLEELLGCPEVEAVVNLSIHTAHAEVTRRVLEAGKHVHSEKPLATRRDEAQALVELAEKKKLLLGCSPFVILGEAQQTLWKAVREVFPSTNEQRCWFHKQANVLAALPKSAHPAALAAIKNIYNAEDIDKAQIAVKAFEADFGAKYPRAVSKIVDDLDTLLEFYKYPAEHWIHLRTTNPIESTFATVRLRTKVTKGPGSRAAGLAMAYKLIDAAQARWRSVNAPHLVALVRAGAVFHKGKLLERPTNITPPTTPSDGEHQQARTGVA